MSDFEIVVFECVKYRRFFNSRFIRLNNYFYSYRKGRSSLHRDIWKHHYGDIPKGHHIHHKDGNTLNNSIENLECLSLSDHTKLHYEEIRKGKNKWNKTEEAKKIKSKQSKAIWKNRKPIEMICEFCGKSFNKHSTRGLKNKFCSQPCTIKAGLLSGEYLEDRKCCICEKGFSCLRYKKKSTCSKECKSKKHSIYLTGRKKISLLPQ